jgi:hypothetical protein
LIIATATSAWRKRGRLEPKKPLEEENDRRHEGRLPQRLQQVDEP